MGIFFGLFALLGWGTTDFLAALNSRKVGSVITLFWSTLAGLILMLLYLFVHQSSFPFSFYFYVLLGIAGALQAFGSLSFYKALVIGKVSLASPIASSFAMWTVLLSLLFLHETLTPFQLAAIVLVLVGTFLVSTNLQLLKKDLKKGIADKGILFAFLASLFWGVSFTIYSPLTHQAGWLISSVGLRFFLLVTVFLFAAISKEKLLFKPQPLPLLFFCIMFFTDVTAYFGYSIGLEHGLTAIVSPVAAAFPLVTVLLARIVLKEKVVPNQLVGIIGIILGVVLLSI